MLPSLIHQRRLVFAMLFAVAASLLTTARMVAAADDGKSAAIEIAEVKRAEPVDFAKDILPILRTNCTACHNVKDHEAKLVLETPDAIRKGSENGPVVVPGKSAESLLLKVTSRREK